jgi:hypothetical protein
MTNEEILMRRRRPSLTVEQLMLISAALSPLTIGEAIGLRRFIDGLVAEESDPGYRHLTDAYRAGVSVEDLLCETDGDSEVSMGEDDGAYVQVWTWVSNAAAGLPSIHDEDEQC